jgi:hypothetical protein
MVHRNFSRTKEGFCSRNGFFNSNNNDYRPEIPGQHDPIVIKNSLANRKIF